MVNQPATLVTKMIMKHAPKHFRWNVDIFPGDVFDLEPYRYVCLEDGVIEQIRIDPNVEAKEIYGLEIHQGFLSGNYLMFITGSYYDRQIVRVADFCNENAIFNRIRAFQAKQQQQQLQELRRKREKMKMRK